MSSDNKITDKISSNKTNKTSNTPIDKTTSNAVNKTTSNASQTTLKITNNKTLFFCVLSFFNMSFCVLSLCILSLFIFIGFSLSAFPVIASSGYSVACINTPPKITPFPNLIAYTGMPFVFGVEYTDADDHSVVFSDDSDFFDINSTTGMINFTPLGPSVSNVTIRIVDETDCDNNWDEFMFEFLIHPEPEPFYIQGRAFINGYPARKAVVSFWTDRNGKLSEVVTNDAGFFEKVRFVWDTPFAPKRNAISFGDRAEHIIVKINGVRTSIPSSVTVLMSDEGSVLNIDFYARIPRRSGVCISLWECSPWSMCYPNGTQYRECIDLRKCQRETKRPPESRDCVFEEAEEFLFDFRIPPEFKIVSKGEFVFGVLQLPFSSNFFDFSNSSEYPVSPVNVSVLYSVRNPKGILVQTEDFIAIERPRIIGKTFEISDLYLPDEYIIEVNAVYSDYNGEKNVSFVSSDSFAVIERDTTFLERPISLLKEILGALSIPIILFSLSLFILIALFIYRLPLIIIALRKRIIIHLRNFRQVRSKKIAVKRKHVKKR